MSRNPAQFDEVKLRWLNGVYIRELAPEELARRLEGFTGREGLAQAARISQEKIQTLADFWPLAGFLFDGVSEDPTGAREAGWTSTAGRSSRRRARRWPRRRASRRQGCSAPWSALQERLGCKPREIYQPLRVAIAGTAISPGIFESVALLGREETLGRIDAALEAARSAS